MTYAGADLRVPIPSLAARIALWWDAVAPEAWTFPGYTTRGLQHLPIPAPPPRVRALFNTLVNPSGASRWAYLHALIDGGALETLESAEVLQFASGDPRPGILTIADAAGNSVAQDMFLIGIRPVFVGDPDASRQLYWITLVDVRYFWWTQKLTIAAFTSWNNLLTNLAAAAGPTPTTVPTIPGAYGTPNQARWNVPNVPIPLLMDAAAKQVGLRYLFYGGTGSVYTAAYVTAAAAAASDSAQYASAASRVSYGGRTTVTELIGNVPADATVAFWGDTPNLITVSLASLALAAYDGYTGVSNTTAWLMSDQAASASSPTPLSVATQMATDYYSWLLSFTDAAFAGVLSWTPTGLEDRVEWQFAPGAENISELSNTPLLGDQTRFRVLTRVVRANWADSNIYGDAPPSSQAASNAQLVELIASGPGIDGGTAWSGAIYHESGGGEVTGDLIGADCGSGSGSGADGPFVMYPTPGADGSNGNPQPGDTVVAIPDPDKACVWGFIPFVGDRTKALCQDCGFLLSLTTTSCLRIRSLGGDGVCGCFPQDTEGDCFNPGGTLAIYDDFLTAWVPDTTKSTCAGCGGFIFKLDDGAASLISRAKLQLLNVSVSSVDGGSGSGSGGLFSYDMWPACCGVDECGHRFVQFVGYSRDACADVDPAPCGPTFRLIVYCLPCPSASCSCQGCYGELTPLAFWAEIDSFTDPIYNGFKTWTLESQGPPDDGGRYTCLDGSCIPDAGGEYATLADCEAACGPLQQCCGDVLFEGQEVAVHIPDGVNAGDYIVGAENTGTVIQLTLFLNGSPAMYLICVPDIGWTYGTFVDPTTPVPTVSCPGDGSFSATIPGTLLGSTGDVTFTV